MKHRILVVEDDLSGRGGFQVELSKAGYEVRAAAHKGEAARWLKKAEWDLLVLDLDLLTEDGFDLLDVAANDPKLGVLVITAHLDECESGSLIGADAVIEKPIDTELLLGALEMLLQEPSGKRMERRARGASGIRFITSMPGCRNRPREQSPPGAGIGGRRVQCE